MPKRVYRRAYASVRFMAPNLDPMTVTKSLRLPPDLQYRDGEPRLVRSKKGKVQEYGAYRGGLWSMSSEHWVESPRLETHLNWLLAQLEPHAAVIRNMIANGTKVDFFCYSLGSTDVPPPLPRTIRERAESLGISIDIDHYIDIDND